MALHSLHRSHLRKFNSVSVSSSEVMAMDEHQNWTHDSAGHDVSVRVAAPEDQEQAAGAFAQGAMHL